MGALWQDLRYATRMLRKSPGFTVVVVLTLALGIGVNSAIFSVVNAFIFRPLPLRDIDSLVWIFSPLPKAPYAYSSYPDYLDMCQQNTTFSALAAEGRMPLSLRMNDQAEQIWSLMVTGNYFPLLNSRTSIGRALLPQDVPLSGASPVVVLSHRFWKQRFNSDPDVVGKPIILDGQTFTVVGVLSEGFRGPGGLFAPDLWIPLETLKQISPGSQLLDRSNGWLQIVGRLKPGVTFEKARANLRAIARQLELAYPESNANRSSTVFPMKEKHPEARDTLRKLSLILMINVGLVLLIACFNVTSLLLAKAADRQKEIGIRVALGATTGRVFRQVLTESLLLSLLGGVVGLVWGAWSTDLFAAFAPPAPIPQTIELRLDFRVVGFTLLLALLAGIIPSLAPALYVSKLAPMPVLKDESVFIGPGFQKNRLRSFIIMLQVAVSAMLLAVAGLFLRSWWNFYSANPGFETKSTLKMALEPGLYGYDVVRAQALIRQLMEHIESLPGVRASAVADRIPLEMGRSEIAVSLGDEDCVREECLQVSAFSVGPRYFETLGIPLLQGRDLSWRDGEGLGGAAIVNETMAKRFWPNQNPIGMRLRVGVNGPYVQIVGLAQDVKYQMLNEPPQSAIFLPLQRDGFTSNLSVIVRAAGDPHHLVSTLRDQVRAIDANLPVVIKTMAEHMELPLWVPRTAAAFFAVSGLLALTLTAVGIYGLIFYLVAQRTRELGIRIALGAQRRDIFRLVIGEGLIMTVSGTAIGLIASFGLTRLLSRALFDVSPTDPVTLTTIAMLLALVALSACYFPARRATRVDPMEALRYE